MMHLSSIRRTKNSNTMWVDAIAKEMNKVQVEFNPSDENSQPNGYQFMRCHMIINVKMEDFHWKVQLVAGGHITDVSPTMMYASVYLMR